MTNLISEAFISDLLARTDIANVIGDHIFLKKIGQNYSALCPFHKEKTPSFSVNSDKQFFYCFGCGTGGNAITFLCKHSQLSFPEAVNQLASSVGLSIPTNDQSQSYNQQSYALQNLQNLLAEAAKYYTDALESEDQAQHARDYLERRAFSDSTIKRFGIGFAPAAWSHLKTALNLTGQRFDRAQEAGLIIINENNPSDFHDRFRNRLMFPIRNIRGHIIGFGGRALNQNAKAKYLNSPETPVFHKGSELYGLYEARQYGRQSEQLVIVEGYTDVIAMAEHGFHCAVATLGTATTEQHIKKLFKYTNKLLFCFDGDSAGEKAAKRAMEYALPMLEDNRQIRFLLLPKNEDPDSLIKKEGAEAFKHRLTDQPLAIDEFLIRLLSQSLDIKKIDGKARLAEHAKPFINQVPGTSYRNLLIKAISDVTGINELSLSTRPHELQTSSKLLPRKTRFTYTNQDHSIPTTSVVLPLPIARKAIKLILEHPELAKQVDVEQLKPVSHPDKKCLIAITEALYQCNNLSTSYVLGQWHNTPEGHLLSILLERDQPIVNLEEFKEALQKLYADSKRTQLETLSEKHRLQKLAENKTAAKKISTHTHTKTKI